MSSFFRYLPLLLCLGPALAAADGFMLGGGVERDSDDGVSLALLGGLELGASTWLSASAATSNIELQTGVDVESRFADIEIDHDFGPLGASLGVGYWGDADLLASRDRRASVYWRGEKARIAVDYEFRDLRLTTPGTILTPGRRVRFDADGLGASLRFDLGDTADLRLAGMSYDYSVSFQPLQDRDIVDLVSVSRLSIINSLVETRASVAVGVDRGQRRWELEAATSRGAVARDRTNSYTVRFLTPVGKAFDIELGLGVDDSDTFGDVTFLSLYLYLYGG